MLAEVTCILVGIPLGYALRHNTPLVRGTTRMASGVIYVLLFLLGLSLGSNEHLLARLGELGLRGFAIGMCCALGSIVVTACIAKKYFCTSSLQRADKKTSAS
ncbi:MAG: LysO family transporter [Desulfovibrionaceae bacterium]